jgi:hypothetical protein
MLWYVAHLELARSRNNLMSHRYLKLFGQNHIHVKLLRVMR